MHDPRKYLLIVLVVLGCFSVGQAQIPELINYQGRIIENGVGVNGSTQIIFRLFDAPSVGILHYAETQIVSVIDGFYTMGVGLSNGTPGALFAVFTNTMVYLELEVGGEFLSPRERILSVPYAMIAERVPDGAITAAMLVPGAANDADANPTNEMVQAIVLNGTDLEVTDASGTLTADLSSLSVDTNAVRITGDTMTGSLTNQGSVTASRYFNVNNTASGQDAVASGGRGNTASGVGSVVVGGSNNNAIGASSFIGGGALNIAGDAASDLFVVIAGGTRNMVTDHHSSIIGGLQNRITQEYSTIGGGLSNLIENTYGFIGGGRYNWIRARDNVIGGGGHNLIDTGDIFSFVGGGESNKIYNDRCVIGGGRGNVASNIYIVVAGGDQNIARGDSSTIGGGWTNYIGSADAAVIGGGRGNKIYNNCDYSVVPGGRGNIISNSADYAFAAGLNARANHDGTFVWADHNSSVVESTAENQFIARASGGYILYSANNTSSGVRLNGGSGSWASLSDRNSNQGFMVLDGEQVLIKLCGIPIQTWSYKDQAAHIRHAGPMAQDFYAAFGLGEDERHISSIDSEGIALSAIQGLYSITREENAELRLRIKAQDTEMNALKARLYDMETRMQTLLP